jgi:hypothetical protein
MNRNNSDRLCSLINPASYSTLVSVRNALQSSIDSFIEITFDSFLLLLLANIYYYQIGLQKSWQAIPYIMVI